MSSTSKTSKCPRCGKVVYFAERAKGPGGDWHKTCLKCLDCRKLLDSTTLTEHEGEVYCKACYAKHFGPHGFGFAGGASIMHTQGAAPAPSAPSSSAPKKAVVKGCYCPFCGVKFDERPKFCPECGEEQKL